MRIISGKYRGRTIHTPKGLPVRPTTDRTKEALFNILRNRYDLEGLEVLDLFSGTGNMSLEFWSRKVAQVISVDQHHKCVSSLRNTMENWGIAEGKAIRMDARKFLKQTPLSFDIIFMDPPYQLPRQEELIQLVFERNLLNPDGLLVLEHAPQLQFTSHPHLEQVKTYGSSCLSFFS